MGIHTLIIYSTIITLILNILILRKINSKVYDPIDLIGSIIIVIFSLIPYLSVLITIIGIVLLFSIYISSKNINFEYKLKRFFKIID